MTVDPGPRLRLDAFHRVCLFSTVPGVGTTAAKAFISRVNLRKNRTESIEAMGGHQGDPLGEWGLLPSDDALHEPSTDDPWWTETVWFGWMVPERKILGYFYPGFRANLGIMFGNVLVTDPSADLPWEIPFFEEYWHLKLPAEVDLRDATFENGMALKCLEPGRIFEFSFRHRHLELDLRYEALMKPLVTRGTPPFNHGNHIDQPGHVTGSMKLRGEELRVDCFSMRDRSWGIRRDGRQPRVGYCYATASGESGFLSISVMTQGTDVITTGFLMRDGEWSRLASGTREVTRDARGRPIEIRIHGVDELGRSVISTGTVASRQVFKCYPSMFCWNSLVEWKLDGQRCWGEDQDIWHPEKWREYALGLKDR
jgi:hypothetical protein